MLFVATISPDVPTAAVPTPSDDICALPLTVNPVNVPSDVMLPCAAPDTVAA